MTLRRHSPRRPSQLFAEQMRIQRARKGWSQKQLAARLSKLGFAVHQTTIGRWEAGTRRISLDEALAISVALDVGPAHMLSGSYSDGGSSPPRIALSPKTPQASPRQVRMWIRGELALWGQDEKRYYTEVAADEWLALQRPGVLGLLRAVHALVDALADGDRQEAVEVVEMMQEELERQQHALEREAGGRTPAVVR